MPHDYQVTKNQIYAEAATIGILGFAIFSSLIILTFHTIMREKKLHRSRALTTLVGAGAGAITTGITTVILDQALLNTRIEEGAEDAKSFLTLITALSIMGNFLLGGFNLETIFKSGYAYIKSKSLLPPFFIELTEVKNGSQFLSFCLANELVPMPAAEKDKPMNEKKEQGIDEEKTTLLSKERKGEEQEIEMSALSSSPTNSMNNEEQIEFSTAIAVAPPPKREKKTPRTTVGSVLIQSLQKVIIRPTIKAEATRETRALNKLQEQHTSKPQDLVR